METQLFDSTAVIDTAAAMQTIHENAHLFTEIDPFGIGISIIGMLVVFSSLLLLSFCIMNLAKVLAFVRRRKRKLLSGASKVAEKEEIHSGEVNAAIAMALYLYAQEQHDQDSLVLTINRVAKTYSPWSSKIYGLRQHPRL